MHEKNKCPAERKTGAKCKKLKHARVYKSNFQERKMHVETRSSGNELYVGSVRSTHAIRKE